VPDGLAGRRGMKSKAKSAPAAAMTAQTRIMTSRPCAKAVRTMSRRGADPAALATSMPSSTPLRTVPAAAAGSPPR